MRDKTRLQCITQNHGKTAYLALCLQSSPRFRLLLEANVSLAASHHHFIKVAHQAQIHFNEPIESLPIMPLFGQSEPAET